jgi:hypothetical protein
MMGVDFQVALAFQFQVHHRMPGEQRQHVIEKGYSGRNGGFAFAVQVDAGFDPGFGRVALDLGTALSHSRYFKQNRTTNKM